MLQYVYMQYCRNQSRSRSSTPEAVQSKVEYITEFGTASDHDEGNVISLG